MLLLRGHTTLRQGEEVWIPSSSLQRYAHVNLHPERPSLRDPATNGTSVQYCPPQQPGHSPLNSSCLVAICGVAVMWATFSRIHCDQKQLAATKKMAGNCVCLHFCASTVLSWRRYLGVWRDFVAGEVGGLGLAAPYH